MRTLDRPGLRARQRRHRAAGYIPDSFRTLQQLQRLGARGASRGGGGRITIRLVKGANMEMERVEASLRGWPQAPYQTQARDRRQLQAHAPRGHEAGEPRRHATSASPRTTCSTSPTAWCWPHERDALDQVQFEMLEGMANHQRRALFELSRNLLLYAPGLPEGELHQRHRLPHPPARREHRAGELPAPRLQARGRQPGVAAARAGLPRRVRRHRRAPATRRAATRTATSRRAVPPAVARGWQHFANEPDTDFALPQNGEWAERIIAQLAAAPRRRTPRRCRW